MPSTLRRLLAHVVDYAGIFPPAALALDRAVAEYHVLLSSDDEWIVNRFVCPAERLAECESLVRPLDPAEPWAVTALGRGLEHLADDAALLEGVSPALLQVEAFEVRVPIAETARLPGRLRTWDDLDVYIELPSGDGLVPALQDLAAFGTVGAKLRTGGPTPADVPSSETLATFLRECHSLDLPYKLTAGLHHPVRHDDGHGFLNVAFAAVLADSDDLSRDELVEVLDERDPAVFRVEADGLAWRDLRADEEAIDDARGLFVGFGSCSVAEPLERLAAGGWLRAEATR